MTFSTSVPSGLGGRLGASPGGWPPSRPPAGFLLRCGRIARNRLTFTLFLPSLAKKPLLPMILNTINNNFLVAVGPVSWCKVSRRMPA